MTPLCASDAQDSDEHVPVVRKKQWIQAQPLSDDKQNVEVPGKNKRNDRSNRKRRGFGARTECDRTQKVERQANFDIEDAKKLAKGLVDDIITKAIEEFSYLKKTEKAVQDQEKTAVECTLESEPPRDESPVNIAVELVNKIISTSIDQIISESCMKISSVGNLSMAEAELLSDMCEDEFLDKDSLMKDIDNELIIKNEPNCAGG